jgi:hypothetical protein
LQENSQELDLLFKELLIGVTSFFRDPACWEELRKKSCPRSSPPGKTARSARVGAGMFHRRGSLFPRDDLQGVDRRNCRPGVKFRCKCFATDLDKDAIDKARQGVYPENICADVAPARLSRFFTKDEHGCRVTAEIRKMVTFAPQSLIMDPPFTKLDILSCRNLLIYLAPEMQKKLIPAVPLQPHARRGAVSRQRGNHRHVHRSVRAAEQQAAPLPADGISVAPGTDRVSLRVCHPAAQRPGNPARAETPASLQTLADQLVLERYAPPAVLVNDKGNILYVSGRTGKYLEPAAGKRTGTFSRWRAKACVMNSAMRFTRRSIRTAPWWCGGCTSIPTTVRIRWNSRSSGSNNRNRCVAW